MLITHEINREKISKTIKKKFVTRSKGGSGGIADTYINAYIHIFILGCMHTYIHF